MMLEALLIATASIFGWKLPGVALSRLAALRRSRFASGLPDALDLLVICTGAGLSFDMAMAQVSRELRSSNRNLAYQLAITVDEMRILSNRRQALENLARRVDLPNLRSIISALNQSLKYGTPLGDSLRTLSREMRAQQLMRIEERAARLSVLLTIPLMVFILPSLMIVVGTPLALRILDMLSGPLANGH